MVEVQLSQVQIRDDDGIGLVTLSQLVDPAYGPCEQGSGSKLMIVVAASQAKQLMARLEGLEVTRPDIHEVMLSVLDSFEAKMPAVVIHGGDEGVYLAKLIIAASEKMLEIDARPSDAFLLATQLTTPMYVDEDTWDQRSKSRK